MKRAGSRTPLVQPLVRRSSVKRPCPARRSSRWRRRPLQLVDRPSSRGAAGRGRRACRHVAHHGVGFLQPGQSVSHRSSAGPSSAPRSRPAGRSCCAAPRDGRHRPFRRPGCLPQEGPHGHPVVGRGRSPPRHRCSASRPGWWPSRPGRSSPRARGRSGSRRGTRRAVREPGPLGDRRGRGPPARSRSRADATAFGPHTAAGAASPPRRRRHRPGGSRAAPSSTPSGPRVVPRDAQKATRASSDGLRRAPRSWVRQVPPPGGACPW